MNNAETETEFVLTHQINFNMVLGQPAKATKHNKYNGAVAAFAT